MIGAGARMAAILALLLSLALTAAAQTAGAPPPDFTSPLVRDHPLVGRIWSPREERFVSPDELVASLSGADVVLLGEVHDNADHHAWQGWLVDVVSRRRRARDANASSGAIVFEHIRTDQQPALDEFAAMRAENGSTARAAKLFELLRWEESGWPSRDMFTPLLERALALGLPILPGEAPRATIRAVAKSGPSAIDPQERKRLGLDASLDPRSEADLHAEIEASHCGLVPASAVDGMALAQRTRDAHLAAAAADAATRHGASFLVAGNGHVRRDRGVPWHLARIAPRLSVASVLMVEVEDGKTETESYGVRGPDQTPAADFVVFTPRAEREDPCEAWRARASQPAK
jgi:uncharacterized iron-regulated protein